MNGQASRHTLLIESVVSPIIRRIQHQAKVHAQKPTFNKWLEEDLPSQSLEFVERISPAVRVIDYSVNGSTANRTQPHVRDLLDFIAVRLGDLADSVPVADLPNRIDELFREPALTANFFASSINHVIAGKDGGDRWV